MRSFICLLSMASLTAVACSKHEPAQKAPAAAKAAKAASSDSPSGVAASAIAKVEAVVAKRPALPVGTILSAAPAGATALGSIDARGLFELLGRDVGALFPGIVEPAKLRADLGAVLKDRLGSDLLDAKPMVLFFRPTDMAAAAWIPDLQGSATPKGMVEVEPHAGVRVYELVVGLLLAEVGEGVAIGNRAGLVAAIDVASGKAPNAASDPATSRLGPLLKGLAGSTVRVAAVGDELLQRAGGAISKAGVTTVGFGILSGTTLRFAFGGPKDAREKLQNGIKVARSLLKGAVATRRQRLEKEGGLTEALLAVLGEHVVRGLHDATKIEENGELVSVDLRVGTVMMPLMAGLGAAVIPALTARGSAPIAIPLGSEPTVPAVAPGPEPAAPAP